MRSSGIAPLLLRRYSGQTPARLVISDQARALVDIAQSTFGVTGAEYLTIDVQNELPFSDGGFDLILATMLFNELPLSALRHAAQECHRVLTPGGRLLATVTHPAMIHSLAKKGALTDFGRGLFAMPSAGGCGCRWRGARSSRTRRRWRTVGSLSRWKTRCPTRRRSAKSPVSRSRALRRWR